MQPTALPALQQTPQKSYRSEAVLTKRHEEILEAVHQLRYVTAQDIARLFYTPSSINHVREILSLLAGKKDYAERHYLFRFPLPNTRIGGTEKIYTLGSRGRLYLKRQGIEVDWYFRPYKIASMTYQNCLHALTLTRFLVAAQVFCKDNPAFELSEIKTEYDLKKEIALEKAKHQAATVVVQAGSKEDEEVTVIPDAWLLFHNLKKKKDSWQPVFVEIDRASEQQKFFKRQVRARLLFFTNGGYKKVFGTNKGIIAYATTGNETRMNSMLRWTQEVLHERFATHADRKHYAALFRFCCLPTTDIGGSALFTAPVWSRPGEQKPLPLLAS
jgi:Replication-relaxation